MLTLDQLADRAELSDLIARLGRWLDGGALGDAPDVLADSVVVTSPGGRAEGREAVVAQARANHEVRTVHAITDVLVDQDGDEAAMTANVTATFANDAAVGGRYDFTAARTADGWRLTSIAMETVWRRGV